MYISWESFSPMCQIHRGSHGSEHGKLLPGKRQSFTFGHRDQKLEELGPALLITLSWNRLSCMQGVRYKSARTRQLGEEDRSGGNCVEACR